MNKSYVKTYDKNMRHSGVMDMSAALDKKADIEYVNELIQAATATFRGTYNVVTDLSLAYNATHSQIEDALETKMAALSIVPDNNDYSFVQIPTSDETQTEINKVEKYTYNGSAWAYEYELNNSGFTDAQWSAINSGATLELIGKLSALPTNAELTTLLNAKVSYDDNGAYDVSAHNSGATFASLSDLLSNEKIDTLIPAAVRKGGMSIKFVCTYDKKYVQYRLMSDSFNTTPYNWQGVDEEPTAGSDNLVKSGGVYITTPTISTDDSTADLNIGDEDGNVLVQFKDGHVKTKNFDSSSVPKTIEIPFNIEDFTTYVNDVVQIFKYPVTFIPNYRDYSVNIFMDTTDRSIKKQCRCLERFAEVTPLATGVYPMGVKVFTHDGCLLGEKSFNMTVINKPSNPSSVVNVLCIGDSITQGITNLSGISVSEGASESGIHPWVIEVKSYLGNREGNNTTPAGLNLPNIHLIGKNNTNNARHEGHGGWSVSTFLGTGSPFYINGEINFDAYLAQDDVYDDTSNKGVDFIYILLGANSGTETSIVNGKIFIDPSDYSRSIKLLLDKIKEQIIEGNGTYANPNCKVILLSYPSQWISGYGYHPNGGGQWTDGTVTARKMMACYYENVKIAAMDDYKSFCSTYMVAPFVDSENSFAYINKQINKRVSETYKALIEQVHPNSLGYTMMGEAVVRDIISRL